MSNWVRLWEDMPTDPKWRVVAKRSGRPLPEVLAVFVHMMTCAGNASHRGTIEGWNDEDVSAALDMEPEHVAAIREAMQGKTLDGEELTGWEKRQPKREDGAAERAKEWRERNRTQPNAGEPPEKNRIDTDTEKKETRAPRASLDPKEFQEGFWPIWPNKVGKPAAERSFIAARRRATLAEIVAGVHAYIASKPADRPWLNPATFLNQDRFNDRPANVLQFGIPPPAPATPPPSDLELFEARLAQATANGETPGAGFMAKLQTLRMESNDRRSN